MRCLILISVSYGWKFDSERRTELKMMSSRKIGSQFRLSSSFVDDVW